MAGLGIMAESPLMEPWHDLGGAANLLPVACSFFLTCERGPNYPLPVFMLS